MMLRILPLLMLPLVGFAQTNSNVEMPMGGTTTSEKQPLEIKRNATYNLEEIKVRWKKAALENCTGVPCVVEPPAPSFTCGTSTISDIDGNSYPTVLIGTQCWTQTNLKVTKYNDGTAILLDATGGLNGNGVGQTWSNRNTGAYTIYGNTGSNATTYGFLYNWYAASDAKKICPSGWHVPSKDEWDALARELGGQSVAGAKMKSQDLTLWTPGTTGNNSSGFTVLPGGLRYPFGTFGDINIQAQFWSTSADPASPPGYSWSRNLFSNADFLGIGANQNGYGFSVRCLKD